MAAGRRDLAVSEAIFGPAKRCAAAAAVSARGGALGPGARGCVHGRRSALAHAGDRVFPANGLPYSTGVVVALVVAVVVVREVRQRVAGARGRGGLGWNLTRGVVDIAVSVGAAKGVSDGGFTIPRNVLEKATVLDVESETRGKYGGMQKRQQSIRYRAINRVWDLGDGVVRKAKNKEISTVVGRPWGP